MPISSVINTPSETFAAGFLRIKNKTIVWCLKVDNKFRVIPMEYTVKKLVWNEPQDLFETIERHIYSQRLFALFENHSTKSDTPPECFILIFDEKTHPIFDIAKEMSRKYKINTSDFLGYLISIYKPKSDRELVILIGKFLLEIINNNPEVENNYYLDKLFGEISMSKSLERIIILKTGILELHNGERNDNDFQVKNDSESLSFLPIDKNAGLEEGQDLGALDYHFHYSVKYNGKMKRTYNLLTFDSRKTEDILFNEYHSKNKYLNENLPLKPKSIKAIYNVCLEYMNKIGKAHFRNPSNDASVYFNPAP